ncbi:hypothetical protein TKK_0001168 [Trichogramma kaykai]|uniref:LITAF domain-containing protein n=1 Tax=Trichogramma kaykai TaxID=54128 RepID=A0ABD2WVX8_9HYME
MSQVQEVLKMEEITKKDSEQEQVQNQSSDVAQSDTPKMAENEAKVEAVEHDEQVVKEEPQVIEENCIVREERSLETEAKSEVNGSAIECASNNGVILEPTILSCPIRSQSDISTVSTVSAICSSQNVPNARCKNSNDCRNTVITLQPSAISQEIVNPPFQFGPNPMRMECPYCHETMYTHVECHNTAAKNSLMALLCFSVICCPCSCYLCCSETYRKSKHYCKKCDAFLGIFVDH